MFEQVSARHHAQRGRLWLGLAGGAASIAVGWWLIHRYVGASEQAEHERYVAAEERNPLTHAENRTYRRVPLPGMSLEVPSVSEQRGGRSDGWVRNVVFGWNVEWAEPAAADLQQRIGEGATRLQLGGAPAFQREQPGTVITIGSCDDRTVVITTRDPGARLSADRMVASFRCQPDDVVVEPRSGWTRVDRDLVDAHGARVRPVMLSTDPDETIPNAVAAWRSQLALGRTPSSRDDRLLWTGWSGTDRARRAAAVLAWHCEGGRIAAVRIEAGADGDLAAAVDLAMTARCVD